MNILKIKADKAGKINKSLSSIKAIPEKKSIEILDISGSEFSTVNLKLLQSWIELYKQNYCEEITLNYRAYQAAIGSGYFNKSSFPVKLSSKSWKELPGRQRYIDNLNKLGEIFSRIKTFNFSIEGTASTFDIQAKFNTGLIKIQGRFCDYEPFLEFEPIVAWIENYISQGKKKLDLEFKLTYFNTAMSFVIKHFLTFVKETNLEIGICWYYPFDDPDMKEAGIEYIKLLGFSDKTMYLVDYEID